MKFSRLPYRLLRALVPDSASGMVQVSEACLLGG
jgi:hypothetical protein